LTLEHNYPVGASSTKVVVDIKLVQSTISFTDTRIGEWVNVLGYVMGGHEDAVLDRYNPCVQAIMLWSAGSVKPDGYEKSLELRLAKPS
jgi:hypothetical protein